MRIEINKVGETFDITFKAVDHADLRDMLHVIRQAKTDTSNSNHDYAARKLAQWLRRIEGYFIDWT